MGRMVQLWKFEDTAEAATYLYGPSKEQSGRLTVSKKEKTVTILSPIPKLSEDEDRGFYRDLAIVKLQMLSSRETYPDETFIGT